MEEVVMQSSQQWSESRRSLLKLLGAGALTLVGGQRVLASASPREGQDLDVSKWSLSGADPSEFTEASGVFQDSILAVGRDTSNQLWGVMGQWY